jgi:hypothetical protein
MKAAMEYSTPSPQKMIPTATPPPLRALDSPTPKTMQLIDVLCHEAKVLIEADYQKEKREKRR